MLNIIGWVIWSLVLVITASFIYGLIRSIQLKRPFSRAIVIQSILFLVVLFIFYLSDLSKLHLLWVTPVVFFGSGILAIGKTKYTDEVSEKK